MKTFLILFVTIFLTGCYARNQIMCEWTSPNDMTPAELEYCKAYVNNLYSSDALISCLVYGCCGCLKICSAVPCSTTLPFCITITR